jgi:hypothetical protein
MKVKEIIEQLKNNYDEDDSVVIAWWDKESFDPDLVNNPSLNWESACYRMDDIDWHSTYEKIADVLETWLEVEQ